MKILKNEVNFVIHLAANVRFDQSLKKAASSVKSTVDLLELSKDMVDLKVAHFLGIILKNVTFEFQVFRSCIDSLFQLYKFSH